MPWCPVCKNEYKDGITHCVDCDVDLVEELTEERKSLYFGDQERLEKINAFFIENGVESGSVILNESDNEMELSILESDVKKAVKLLSIFLSEEEKKKEKNSEEESQEEEKKIESVKAYVNKKDKAEEYKASAYTLIGVGILGVVFLICMGLGVLPIQLTFTTKVMMYVVLGALFAVFLVFGVLSIKSYKKNLAESDDEEQKIKEIEDYLEKELTSKAIDEALGFDSVEEANSESMYFDRTEVIERKIKETYPDLDESLVAKLTDDFYTKIYEE